MAIGWGGHVSLSADHAIKGKATGRFDHLHDAAGAGECANGLGAGSNLDVAASLSSSPLPREQLGGRAYCLPPVLTVFAMANWVFGRRQVQHVRLALWFCWAFMATLTTLYLPGAAFVFHWPLFASIALGLLGPAHPPATFGVSSFMAL